MRLARIGTLCLFAALALQLPASRGWAARVALVVGNDVGATHDERLRYAEADAARMGDLFVRLSGFGPADTSLLAGRRAGDLRHAFAAIAAKLSRMPGEHLFVFYYSGHADGQALHLGSESFSFAELKSLALALPVATRVLVVDACQSGALARVKGGRPGIAFSIEEAEPPRGLAIIASSRDSELSQESDELGGSFFTHHLHAGLSGLADQNRDGRVSLNEAFAYASQQTLSATAETWAGPQHPTFRYDLVGQTDVMLSYPGTLGTGYGRLALDRPGWFFVRRPHGPLVAEVRSERSESLSLEAGTYVVEERRRNEMETAVANVAAGRVTELSTLATERVTYGRAVRKGGALRASAYAFSLDAQARTSLASLGPAAGLAPGVRFESPRGSLELRLGLGRALHETFIPSTTWDASLAVAALRLWDLRRLTLGVGAELAGTLFRQQVIAAATTHVAALSFGPRLLVELPLAGRLALRADLSLPTYLLPVAEGTARHWSVLPSLRGGVGLGGYL